MTAAATKRAKSAKSSITRNRIFLVLLIALFAIPPLAAWLLIDKWRPEGVVAHGELLTPARPLPAWQGRDSNNGQPNDANVLRGRWNMVYLSSGETCNQVCETSLYNMRQMKIALGKDMERAQTVLLLLQAPDSELSSWLEQEHPAMLKFVLDDTTLPDFMAEAFGSAAVDQGIYLVDPLSNVFMRYDPDVNPRDILKDLQRLFKYSKLG